MAKAVRKHIPESTRLQVLTEAGFKCANPRCNHILTLQLHHMEWVKDGGGNDSTNLLALCPNCHSLHTAGHIPASAISQWKGLLVALNQALDRESTDLLLFIDQIGKQLDELRGPMPFSGDGVLKFSRLVAAGLVRVRLLKGKPMNPVRVYYVELTDRGIRFLEAWMEGDEEKYRQLLAEPAVAMH